jgi:DNA-binding MarR family transcriptional regulator
MHPSADAPTTVGPRDSVDRLLESWAHAAPDLDLSPVAVVARIGRLARVIEQELDATYAEHGLSGADFAALVTLRRLARAGGVSQRRLMRELNLTSGTVSVRVERLLERGWVTTSTDPDDRRNSLVALTDAGLAMFEQVAPAHVATENRLLAALSCEQKGQLVDLLRTLLVSFEGSAGDGQLPRLGLTLAPAHVALELRRAVGLPDHPGLLVREVQRYSPAANAGIRKGDVLVRAGNRELRSIIAFHAAIADSLPEGRLETEAIRGTDEHVAATVVLAPSPDDEPHEQKQLTVNEAGAHTI